VLILGGAEVPLSILGFTPANWAVYPFGSLDVVDFLRSIDVFVYFHHPNWVEAFGRVIAEAMASGLPTILPHHFKPLFQTGAIYAEPHQVSDIVRELSHPETYARASERARLFVRQNFSHQVHVQRVAHALGGGKPAQRAFAAT
jgi:glycosyltransferase involved in cell wall biosynthesis